MRWLRWLNVIEQRVIWARANNIPWKVLEHDFQQQQDHALAAPQREGQIVWQRS